MENQESKESLVVFSTSQGMGLRARLLKVTRFSAVFEMHNASAELRLSEVLQHFRITLADREVYSGKAVVCSLINTGPAVIIGAATLSESAWKDIGFTATNGQAKKLGAEYDGFLAEWQKLYKVRSEYKLVLADMQTYFTDLRLWVDQLELGISSVSVGDRPMLEQELAAKLGESAKATFSALFEGFEAAAQSVEPEFLPAHRIFAKRQLHPLLLCSPFFHRCYVKPLGYAGDYEMVNMMLRNPFEGGSLFAKVINRWFLDQPPVVAHRNRIDYLTGLLSRVAVTAASEGRTARIMNLGCGPAQEVQRFLATSALSAHTDFTLLDFNEETIRNTRALMDEIKVKYGRPTPFHFIKKSVHQLIKESLRNIDSPVQPKFDLVYCAGLFDYLSNASCTRLMELMYEWVKPGGLLVATNVHSSNPSIGWMEHLVDWHLVYRDAAGMVTLVPKAASPEYVQILAEGKGINVFVEVAKPKHG